MYKFMVCDIFVGNDYINKINSDVLNAEFQKNIKNKHTAYLSHYDVTVDRKKEVKYTNIFIPFFDSINFNLKLLTPVSFEAKANLYLDSISYDKFDRIYPVIYSLVNYFKPFETSYSAFKVIIKDIIDGDNMLFGYTDGSVKSNMIIKSTDASAGICFIANDNSSYVGSTTRKISVKNDITDEASHFVVLRQIKTQNISGTNNIGELSGFKQALEYIKANEENIKNSNISGIIISLDSEYVIKSMREYIFNWKNNNYKSSTGKDVKNKELILSIDQLLNELSNKHLIGIRWIEGHSKHLINDICDLIAKAAVQKSIPIPTYIKQEYSDIYDYLVDILNL